MALEITDNNFEQEVLKSDKPVLVDFWAEWCGPCKMIGPIIEELAGEYSDSIKIGKLNVDEHGAIAGNYGIRSIPTLLIFKDGEIADTIIGAVPKAELKRHLDNFAA
ncbi:MAG: thioredoxin [Calditrichaeota bacterium]|nr:MAG: thioredoxin [Calditrichota bacterium]